MSWIHSILQAVAALMISPTVPPADAIWQGAAEWKHVGNTYVYTAESTLIIEQCRQNPTWTLITPLLEQGGHEIFIDDKLLLSTADRSFQKATNFYNTARVPCSAIEAGTKLRWEAFTQTPTIAKLRYFPQIHESGLITRFLRETANVMFAGTLVGLGILCVLLFYGKVERALLYSIAMVCGSYATSFVMFVPGVFQISMRQTLVQSIADGCLWLGLIFIGKLFHLLGYASKRMYQILVGSCVTGILIICVSGNLDQNQVGSTIAFLGGYLFLFSTLANTKLLGHATQYRRRNSVLKISAILVFVVIGFNDLLLAQMGIATEPLLPFSIFCCTSLLALAVNDRIMEAYEERDYLRGNLEKEVERKTEDLRKKSEELEEALSSLKVAQADLVQSAKLAALGTLSAGIAHEINNALNYVNGSIDPMSSILKKDPLTEMDRTKAAKLLKLMKEGLDFTFGIIVNLKRHTSVMGDKNEILLVTEVVDGVLLLLKNKLSGIQVTTEIQDGVRIQASRVSLSQILINLITNATDAIEEAAAKDPAQRKEIKITALHQGSGVQMRIQDSGPGISTKNQERIFDPFFTTKAVGKGTGLGLHIVLSEVKKQGGKVEIQSNPGEGATFIIHFPEVAEGMAA